MTSRTDWSQPLTDNDLVLLEHSYELVVGQKSHCINDERVYRAILELRRLRQEIKDLLDVTDQPS